MKCRTPFSPLFAIFSARHYILARAARIKNTILYFRRELQIMQMWFAGKRMETSLMEARAETSSSPDFKAGEGAQIQKWCEDEWTENSNVCKMAGSVTPSRRRSQAGVSIFLFLKLKFLSFFPDKGSLAGTCQAKRKEKSLSPSLMRSWRTSEVSFQVPVNVYPDPNSFFLAWW